MDEDLYKIGAVAKRTGISPECLRAWERRYGLEPADRAGKTRFYSTSQVERLTAVKSLLDQGHPISQVIRFSDAELGRRLRPAPLRRRDARPRVGLVGGQLILAYREAVHQGEPTARRPLHDSMDVVAQWATTRELEADSEVIPDLDCLIVYVPTLDIYHIEKIEQICPRATLVVVFKYATAADLGQCRDSSRTLLQWPVDWQTLEQQVASSAPRVDESVPCYSDEELVHIALMASRAGCECPRHLAELIGAVNDYEAHAVRCGSVPGGVDDDHHQIEQRLKAARAELELALRVLVEKHGLLMATN